MYHEVFLKFIQHIYDTGVFFNNVFCNNNELQCKMATLKGFSL